MSDGLCDSRTHQKMDRKVVPHTLADLGRRKTDGKSLERLSTKGWRNHRRRFAGARNDQERDKVRQCVRVAPLRQLTHMVRTNQVKEFRAPEPLCVIADGIDAVGDATAGKFLGIHFAVAVSRKGKTKHLKTGGIG